MGASSRGLEKVVRILLERGVDINGRIDDLVYGTLLVAASNGGHVKVVQMLLDKEADVKARGLFRIHEKVL